MKRPLSLALASLTAAVAVLALPGTASAWEECRDTVNACPTAQYCSGWVNVCPMADPENCAGYVDVCLDFVGPNR